MEQETPATITVTEGWKRSVVVWVKRPRVLIATLFMHPTHMYQNPGSLVRDMRPLRRRDRILYGNVRNEDESQPECNHLQEEYEKQTTAKLATATSAVTATGCWFLVVVNQNQPRTVTRLPARKF